MSADLSGVTCLFVDCECVWTSDGCMGSAQVNDWTITTILFRHVFVLFLSSLHTMSVMQGQCDWLAISDICSGFVTSMSCM
jgi:hypothetical protein